MRKPGAYGFWAAYARSKLANILFALELRKRLAAGTGGGGRVVVASLHPGAIKTNLGARGSKQALRTFMHGLFGLFAKVRRPRHSRTFTLYRAYRQLARSSLRSWAPLELAITLNRRQYEYFRYCCCMDD